MLLFRPDEPKERLFDCCSKRRYRLLACKLLGGLFSVCMFVLAFLAAEGARLHSAVKDPEDFPIVVSEADDRDVPNEFRADEYGPVTETAPSADVPPPANERNAPVNREKTPIASGPPTPHEVTDTTVPPQTGDRDEMITPAGPDLKDPETPAVGEHVTLAMKLDNIGSIRQRTAILNADPAPAADGPSCVIFPERSILVSSETEGLVTTIAVEEGDEVKKGDPIAQLDDSAYVMAALEAVINLELLDAELARAERLAKKDAISLIDVLRIEAKKKIAEVAMQKAADEISATRIKSPIDGRIAVRYADAGEFVPRGGKIVEIVGTRTVFAVFWLETARLGDFPRGREVKVIVNNREYTGKVRTQSTLADPSSDTCKIRIEIDNPDGTLLPGMSGKVRY